MKFISWDNEQYRDDDDSLININDGCIARSFLYRLTLHNLSINRNRIDRNFILLHKYYLQYTRKERFNEEEIRCEAASKIK